MKITFLRGTCLGGVGNDANPGDVRDLPEARANELIRLGRAVAGAAQKKPSSKPPVDPVPDTNNEGGVA